MTLIQPGVARLRALSGAGLVAMAGAAMAVVACAGHAPAPLPATSPAVSQSEDLTRLATQFGRLIDDGCYLCLRDVVRKYSALPPEARRSPTLEPVAARAALLFTFRHKELGLPENEDWSIARAVASETARTLPDSQLSLDVAAAVPWNVEGKGEQPLEERLAQWPSESRRTAWRQALAPRWPDSDLAAYAYLAVSCEFGQPSPADLGPLQARHQASPLIQYRWAGCVGNPGATLEHLLQAEPRFQEIEYLLARDDFSAQRYPRCVERATRAWKGIPQFTAAGLLAAECALADEDDARALQSADDVLAIVPTHRRALLARLTALSRLERHEEAVATAQRLIALGEWYLGDAYYWLSWNNYGMNQVPLAMSQVETAKKYKTSLEVYTLAGLLRAKQEEWANARDEFLAALNADGSACDVQSYLGYTEGALADWKGAAGYYERAAGCYLLAARSLEQKIAAASAQPGTDPGAARRLAAWTKRLALATSQRESSVYSAAENFLAAGMIEQATTHATEAKSFPSYTDRANALLAKIEQGHKKPLPPRPRR